MINRKTYTIRRVYILNNKYKIGWVVDCDLNCCMLCSKDFAWYLGRAKHHCRACGSLVCHECSPYITNIPNLQEDKGSRVCRNCFGLKPGIFTPNQNKAITPSTKTNAMKAITPDPITGNKLNSNLFGSTDDSTQEEVSGNVRRRSIFNQRSPQFNPNLMTEEAFIEQYLEKVKELEKDQIPKYYESYLIMRELIPLDIYKSSIPKLMARGLPEKIAQRIWNTRILWLICTHKDDILKIHLADFRSKYFYDGLDIVEMRAIWHILPEWKKDPDNLLEKGKAEWKEGFRSRLDDLIYKEMKGTLSKNLIRNPAYIQEDSDNFAEDGNFHQLHLFDPHLPVVPRFHRSASFMQDAVHSPIDPNSKSPLKTSDPLRNPKLFSDSNMDIDEDEEDLMYLLNDNDNDFNRTPSSSISSSISNSSKNKLLTVNERKTVYFDNIDKSRQQMEEEKNNKYRTFFDEVAEDSSSPFPINTDDIDDETLSLMDLDSNSPLPPRGNAPNIKHPSFSDRTPVSQSYSSRPMSLNLSRTKELSIKSPQRPASSRYSYSPSSSNTNNISSSLPRHSLGTIDTSNTSTPTDSSSYFRNSSSSFSNRSLLSRTSSLRSNNNSPFASSSVSFFSPPTTSFNSVSGLCSLNSANNTPMPGSDQNTDRNSISETFFSPHSSYTPLANQIPRRNLDFSNSSPYAASIDSILLNDDSTTPSPSSTSQKVDYDSEDELPYKTPLTQPVSDSSTLSPTFINNVTLRPRDLQDSGYQDEFNQGEDDDINDDDLLEVQEVTDEYASYVPFKNQANSKSSSSSVGSSANNSIISSSVPQMLGSRTEIKKAIEQCDLPLLKKLLNGHTLSVVLFDENYDSSGLTTTSTSEEINNKTSFKDYEDLYWLIADRLAIIYTEEEDESVCEYKATPIINMLLYLIEEEVIPIDSVNPLGKSLLHLAVEVEIESIGRELIKKGANILLKDKSNPSMSPLAYAMLNSISAEEDEDQERLSLTWLLDEFQSTGREQKLIFFAPNDQRIEFISLFLYYGFATRAQKILKENPKLTNLLKTSSPSSSNSLLQDIFIKCQGNFERMKEPVDTFELLVSLGAEL